METSALQYIILAAGTLVLLFISRRCIAEPQAHGFYRFFAFEAILILVVLNAPFWVDEPLSLRQVVSWILLFASAALALHGFYMLRHLGRPASQPEEGTDFAFEQTANLVTAGAYRFIRHPLYASLLYFAWGTLFKQIVPTTFILASAATAFLYLTARVEERENLRHFGEAYRTYMQHTKMFLPLVF
jgi:protein-S-isoprenylcysteine O-methyltransferase Ste14